jgi:hypothetical protein
MNERKELRGARRYYLAIAAIIALAIGAMVTACQSSNGSTANQSDQTIVTPIGGDAAATPTVAGGIIYPSATSTADSGVGASIDVTPTQVTMGNIVLSLSVQGAQPTFDPGAAVSENGGGDQATPAPQRGYAVLGGSSLKVTNNFDAAQNPPADTPQQMLRHVALQIKDKATGQLIPYAVVSMDLLLQGRPVLQDQALVSMLEAGADVSQMQYGNNVKFPGKGDYQIFVRLQPSPLINSGSSGVAQFNVSIN